MKVEGSQGIQPPAYQLYPIHVTGGRVVKQSAWERSEVRSHAGSKVFSQQINHFSYVFESSFNSSRFVGSAIEFSVPTQEIRVRFPNSAKFSNHISMSVIDGSPYAISFIHSIASKILGTSRA